MSRERFFMVLRSLNPVAVRAENLEPRRKVVGDNPSIERIAGPIHRLLVKPTTAVDVVKLKRPYIGKSTTHTSKVWRIVPENRKLAAFPESGVDQLSDGRSVGRRPTAHVKRAFYPSIPNDFALAYPRDVSPPWHSGRRCQAGTNKFLLVNRKYSPTPSASGRG